MAVIWLLIAVGLAIAEVFTGTFVLLMLAAGALAASLTGALGGELWAQAGAFALVSALALVVVRPAIRRHLVQGGSPTPMGIEAIEGAPGVVVELVDADRGMVKIEGELWSARAYDGHQVIEPGERVRVVEIKGATALVWRE